MHLDNSKIKMVVKLVKKKFLYEDSYFKRILISFLVDLLSSIALTIILIIDAAEVINIPLIILLICSVICTISTGVITFGKIANANQFANIMAYQYINLYDDFNDLVRFLTDSEELSNTRMYTKDGNPIIDVDFEEVPESEIDTTKSIPEEKTLEPQCTFVQDNTLLDDIINLQNYICDVAYEGYEIDLAIVKTIYNLVTNLNLSPEALEGMIDSLHTIADSVLDKACESYDLPMIRKRD